MKIPMPLLVLFLLLSSGLVSASDIKINGVHLSEEQKSSLSQTLGVTLQAGAYWYDNRSGLWGFEGGPTQGQILPGLALTQSMPENISGGGTQVFINGREIHLQEYQALYQAFGMVMPGRYWMDAQGNTGFESGPAFVNLFSALSATTVSGLGHRARGGSVIGDGQTNGFISSDHGISVTCGPDGGCIY